MYGKLFAQMYDGTLATRARGKRWSASSSWWSWPINTAAST